MCGIAGALAKTFDGNDRVLRALAHRGPDGEGALHRPGVWLLHRRLSIIDLSPGGAQPMVKDGCGAIAFNGEIYDFELHRRRLEAKGLVFEAHSDTEVLLRGLAAEGPGFLSSLHGMYALAWLDPTGQRLLLARDHAGMKPLFLWRGSEGVAFASEVRALAEVIRGLGGTVRSSGPALADFLRWGAVPEPACVLEGAEVVPPDTWVLLDVPSGRELRRGAVETVQPFAGAGGPLEATRVAIGRAVRRHLVSDTPVALFLSGGIDSGVLAIEAAAAGGAAPTAVSVVLGSRGTADEEPLVRALASRLGIPLHVVGLEDWPRRLQGAIEAYDQPSVDGLNTFLIAGVARELGFKVALSGVGADEVFGGYAHLHRGLGWIGKVPARSVLAGGLELASNLFDAPRARRLAMLAAATGSGQPVQLAWRRLLPERLVTSLAPSAPPPGLRQWPEDPLLLEQATYLRNTLLRDTDVMGMAKGVEIRAPFLDPEVLGLARGLGTGVVLDRSRRSKWLLRDGWGDRLDAARAGRRKTGFTLDVARWLQGDARDMVEDARRHLELSRWIDPRSLARCWGGWSRSLGSGHPASWVPFIALVQLSQQLRRWGEPA